MSLVLPRPRERYDPLEEVRKGLAIEQADLQNWKHTGDVDHPHALRVRGVLRIDSVGPHAIGGDPFGNIRTTITGTFTSDGGSVAAIGTYLAGTLIGAAGDTLFHAGTLCDANMQTQGATEVVATVCQLYVDEPNITVGAGDTITNAASVYVGAAPTEGINNYAILVASGATRLNGSLAAESLKLGGSTVLDIITGTAAFDPGNLIVGASATTTITVTGAAVGDGVFVNNPFIQDDGELVLTGYVSAADTVTVSLVNAGLAAVDAASRTVRAVVFKF